jgi:methyl-accepting chemotaxis protein
MSRIADISIRTKLYAGFGCVLGFAVLLATVAIVEMSSMNARADYVTGEVVPEVQAVGDMQYSLASFVRHQRELLATTSPSERTDVAEEIVHDRASFAAAAARYSEIAAVSDRTALAPATTAVATYLRETASFVALTNSGRDRAAAGLLTRADVTFTRAETLLDAVSRRQDDEAATARLSLASAHRTARSVILILAAIAALIGAAIAVVISRMIARGLAPVLDRLEMLRVHCVEDLREGLEAVARGDLTVEVSPVTHAIENPAGDEIGQAATAVNAIREATMASVGAYNAMRAELSTLIDDVSGAAGTIGSASQQMAATSEEAGRAVGEIATAIGEVAAGAQRQAQMVDDANATSAETSSAAEQAREVAANGAASAAQASDAMTAVSESTAHVTNAIQALAAKSGQIGGIVQTITGLADQTNLLALNAAIEAARAGEQGRGFAVVAEEVRKLAEQSQQAAGRIADLIREIQIETDRAVTVVEEASSRTQQGASIVEQAREAFAAIDQAVQDVTSKVSQIARATGEVAAVAEQTSVSTQQVSDSTEQTSAGAEELSASARELAGTASRLEELVARFSTAR